MNDYFCVLPFYGLEINETSKLTTSCCLLDQKFNVLQVKLDMLNKQRSPACSKCWQIEDQGVKSDRHYKNEAFDFYSNKDLKLIEEDCHNNIYSTQIVKIYTSTVCNSTCVTCGPQFSSAWRQLLNIKQKTHKVSDKKLQNIDFINLKMLSFVGGEPLYEKKNFEILQKLIDAKNTNCFISFVTNGSVKLSNVQLEVLSQFKNLNVCISIDGIGLKFEYLRYPLLWSDLLTNLNFFRSNGVNISVSYTISNLNSIYYKETTDWFRENNLTFNHNLVTHPNYFSINSLPKNIKESLPEELKALLRPHSTYDDVLFKHFVNAVEFQDKLKHISICDYMPEMFKIIKENV